MSALYLSGLPLLFIFAKRYYISGHVDDKRTFVKMLVSFGENQFLSDN